MALIRLTLELNYVLVFLKWAKMFTYTNTREYVLVNIELIPKNKFLIGGLDYLAIKDVDVL